MVSVRKVHKRNKEHKSENSNDEKDYHERAFHRCLKPSLTLQTINAEFKFFREMLIASLLNFSFKLSER